MTRDIPPTALPFERFVDLSALPEAGLDREIAPEGDDLVRLAQWVGVDAVEAFVGKARLTRLSANRFHYAGELSATVVQACVVSLQPVISEIVRQFDRELHLISPRYREDEAAAALAQGAGDDEAPEELVSPYYNVAGPLLEELVLNIDPYPRAPGVAFAPPSGEADEPSSPFAILKRLKTRG